MQRQKYDIICRNTMNYTLCIFAILLLASCKGQTDQKRLLISSQIGEAESPRGYVYCGFLDTDGNLWFGTGDEGLYSYNEKGFTHYTENDGLCDSRISCISQDNKGNLMLGTSKGFCIFDGREFRQMDIPRYEKSSEWMRDRYPVFNPQEVQSIKQDKNGVFWLGSNGAGLYRFDGQEFTNYLSEVGDTMPDGFYHNIIQSIVEDRDGSLWFASMSHGGVSKYQDGAFTHYDEADGLSDDMVRVIYEAKDGRLWIGFNGNRESGLTVYDGEHFKTFREEDGLCTKNIRAIYEDHLGNLWIGGHRGLCMYDGKEFKPVWDENGEVYDKIVFIVGDNDNNVWFGGQNGFWKYSEGNVVSKIN